MKLSVSEFLKSGYDKSLLLNSIDLKLRQARIQAQRLKEKMDNKEFLANSTQVMREHLTSEMFRKIEVYNYEVTEMRVLRAGRVDEADKQKRVRDWLKNQRASREPPPAIEPPVEKRKLDDISEGEEEDYEDVTSPVMKTFKKEALPKPKEDDDDDDEKKLSSSVTLNFDDVKAEFEKAEVNEDLAELEMQISQLKLQMNNLNALK